MASAHPRQTLDVEDDQDREARIGALLERLNSASSPDQPGPSPAPLLTAPDNGGLSDPSALLNRVRTFLPALAASNTVLATTAAEDPSSVDIENVPRGAAHVRMDLALGVFENRAARASGDEDSSGDSSSSDEDDDSDTDMGSASSDDSASDDESDSNSDGSAPALLDLIAPSARTRRPVKPLPKRARPSIVVLDSSESGAARVASSGTSPPQ